MDDRLEVLVDVDGTLLLQDDSLNSKVVNYLTSLDRSYYKIICWSGGGINYAKNKIIPLLGDFFDDFRDKPAIIIDNNLQEHIWIRHPNQL